MNLCALVIGHKKTSPGAINTASGMTEFEFNDELARDIERAATDVAAVDVIVQRVYRRTYDALPGDINQLDPDFIISLHCNAFNTETSGTEVLYYHKSQKGERMAEILNGRLVDALGLRDRGIKGRTAEDRGGYLLRYTKAPCVIAEPFFIDNDRDLAAANDNRDALIAAYISAITAISDEV